jgi:hypothetical protein
LRSEKKRTDIKTLTFIIYNYVKKQTSSLTTDGQ